MAANSSFITVLLYLCLLHAIIDLPSPVSFIAVSFSINLIRRDSLESPLYDPASTPFSRLHATIHRSSHKFLHTTSLSSNSRLIPGSGLNLSAIIKSHGYDYLARVRFGKKRKLMNLIVDTGSDLTWILCSVCKKCYRRTGFFKPKESSTYNVPCVSDTCELIDLHEPCDEEDSCQYHYGYDDHSKVEGTLSNDTAWLNHPGSKNKMVKVTGFIFGCTHHTEGGFNIGSVGILGLSGHKLSFIGQLGPSIGYMFSYCLTDKRNSKIDFGIAADVSGPVAVSIPMHLNDNDSLYTIDLKNIIVVGPTGKTVNIMPEVQASPGTNYMISDSGTVMTYIEDEAMNKLKKELIELATRPVVAVPEQVADHIDLCFDRRTPAEMPKITLEFEGGAAVPLADPFMEVAENTTCLFIASNKHNGGISIFGSRAQLHHRIGYRVKERWMTILPNDC